MATAENMKLGYAGDSHTAGICPPNTSTLQTTLRITDFAKHNTLKRIITHNPHLNALLLLFGSNDLDSDLRHNKHYIDNIIRAFQTSARDAYEFGVYPFFVEIPPRTQFRADNLAVVEYNALRKSVNDYLKHTLKQWLRYEAVIKTDDIACLQGDGVHLTTESYRQISIRCIQHINNTINTATDTNNNANEAEVTDNTPDTKSESSDITDYPEEDIDHQAEAHETVEEHTVHHTEAYKNPTPKHPTPHMHTDNTEEHKQHSCMTQAETLAEFDGEVEIVEEEITLQNITQRLKRIRLTDDDECYIAKYRTVGTQATPRTTSTDTQTDNTN